ncbi:cytochrome P450 4g15-like [Schistocerca gregaria]|uniref:cytochrome P450 4g15-like n=1 Tax=Schistocerca gregaria TaxID=7010 RepID=UPI00211E566E|nr:cytochrome P450 4g15-like [Schistocerca gregaria]
MSMLVVACGALVSLAAGALALAAWLWATRPRTSIPGPPTLPLLGNATLFYKLPVLLHRLGDLHRRYGDIFRFYAGPKLIIVVTQPDDVQKLMATRKPRERDPYFTYLLSTFLGNGILVNKGEVWKNHRKVIEPAFHSEELEKFMDMFNESGSFLCSKLDESKGAETELSILLTMSAVRSISATIFDIKIDLLIPDLRKQAEWAAQLADFAKTFSTILYRPWTTIPFFKRMTAEGRAIMRIKKAAEDLTGRGIALRRENISNIDINGRSFLTYLHPEKNLWFTITEKDINEEVITLYGAGIETTSDTLGYLLTLLGLHPEWQQMAQRELDDVFGNVGDYLRPVTTADLAQLTVLDAIIKETLRLFSTVPCMPYLVTEDTPLAGGQFLAPRGSTVLVAYYLMHRHPQLFPDPHRFDPSRFLEGGSSTTRKSYSYVPFGVGPRKCVGARYAIMHIKTVLAVVLQRYRILPGSSRKDLEESVVSITAHPITGFKVICIPRDNTAASSV